MTWLSDICDVLRNHKYPQIYGSLERINDDGEIVGKCALGELRCSNKVSTKDICDSNGKIVSSFGVPREFYKDKILPYAFDIESNMDYNVNIQYYIYTLNDAGFTYNEICEFLETTFGDAV